MHDEPSLAATPAAARLAREGDARALGEALTASRQDTLKTFAAYERALGDLRVPYRTELNPPLWELGHIGWFQEWWLARNPHRSLGPDADPDVPRRPSLRPGGDALYNSSLVAHATRWRLPLPSAQATRDDLARQLEQTLALLAAEPDDEDRPLYFYRLALLHEDMHHEAAVYMAQTLGIDLDDERWRPQTMREQREELALDAAAHGLGGDARGFQFDNERGRRVEATGPCRIDTRAVNWAEWIAFAESGAYEDARLWTEAGWSWLRNRDRSGPAVLRRSGRGWQRRFGSGWSDLTGSGLLEAACHLSHHEALAYCRFAGRRLPTEAEWERAALTWPKAFAWGQVWEWTASAFAPFPGFRAHPYRDYSQPWFDGRPVLKGASWATQPRMRHPRYRNFFPAGRDDIVAGLRTCAA
jgi:ergothioneine biosynthesis protein EgtB